VVEEYAVELATVVAPFPAFERLAGNGAHRDGWRVSASHIGELAMGRASVALAGEDVEIELRTISNHPDKAGLIGAVQLAPSWVWPAMMPSSPPTSAAPTCGSASSSST